MTAPAVLQLAERQGSAGPHGAPTSGFQSALYQVSGKPLSHRGSTFRSPGADWIPAAARRVTLANRKEPHVSCDREYRTQEMC
jgi:hypothetical protein